MKRAGDQEITGNGSCTSKNACPGGHAKGASPPVAKPPDGERQDHGGAHRPRGPERQGLPAPHKTLSATARATRQQGCKKGIAKEGERRLGQTEHGRTRRAQRHQ